MADRDDLPQDLAWYQDRWEEMMDLLPVSDPDDVVQQVRELQVNMLDEEAETLDDMGLADAEEAKTVLRRIFERLQRLRRENQDLRRAQEAVGANDSGELVEAVQSLQERVHSFEEQQEELSEAGFEQPAHALEALSSMEEQLQAMYEEKEATEETDVDTELRMKGDTFDQLQALLARQEKLQRELGVSSPDAVVEMVEGLSDQLDELYKHRDDDRSADSIFSPVDPSASSSEDSLQEEIGASDPETVTAMITNLTDQLEALYGERQRLAELDLNGSDDAVEMVKNMQLQLESLYERREKLSEHGIRSINHALSMIENMEEQLSEMYDERHELTTEQGIPGPQEAAARLEELEEELSTLLEEQSTLREKRDQLQAQLDELRDRLELDDPSEIPDLVESMEAQLEEAYASKDASSTVPTGDSPQGPLLDRDTRTRLDDMTPDALAELPIALFHLERDGTIRHATPDALQWPDVSVNTPDALVGLNFFSDVAPGTENTLFRGRITDEPVHSEVDNQFTYTYVSGETPPTNLEVQLYSSPNSSTYWLAFSVLEQY